MGTYGRCQCGHIFENVPHISLSILSYIPYQHYQTTQSLQSLALDFEYQNFAFNSNNYEQLYVENDNIIDDKLNSHEIINSQPLLNNNYDESNRGSFHSRKKNRHIRAKNKANFKLFCLPHGNLTTKIPRNCKLHASLKKSACFDNDLDDDGIKKAVEELFPCLKNRKWRFFRCKSTSNLEIAPEPINGWSISELKRIAGSRKKLYLGTIDGPIQPLPLLLLDNYHQTTIFQASQEWEMIS